MMYKIRKSQNNPDVKVLEHPTTDGDGMSSIALVNVVSVSYKFVELQKRKPNGEPVGSPKKSWQLVFICGETQYGVKCGGKQEAKLLYSEIKALM